MSTRNIHFAVLLVSIVICSILKARVADPGVRQALSEDFLQPVPRQQPRVAIVNAVPFHTEVYCALLWSFQSAGAHTAVFVDLSGTSGVETIIKGWCTAPFHATHEFLAHACSFDVVVFATFPEHHITLVEQLAQKNCSGQRIVGIVHNPRELEQEVVRTMVSRMGMAVLALAPHTVEASRQALQQSGIASSVQLFVPVFPIALQEDTACKGMPCQPSGTAMQKSFVIQGLFQAHRRDYHGLFDSILHHGYLMKHQDFVLRLIGRGDVAISSGLHGKVVKEADLDYPEYYKVVHDALAVLPAFASNLYYTSKASSSVAAAIICGTPLLADHELLAAYSYLSEDAVILKEADEGDAAGMARILDMPAEQLQAKKAAIADLQEELYIQNAMVVKSFLQPYELIIHAEPQAAASSAAKQL